MTCSSKRSPILNNGTQTFYFHLKHFLEMLEAKQKLEERVLKSIYFTR